MVSYEKINGIPVAISASLPKTRTNPWYNWFYIRTKNQINHPTEKIASASSFTSSSQGQLFSWKA
jgi:hypothetical protein